MKNLKKVLVLSLFLLLALPLTTCGDQGGTRKGGGSTGSYPSGITTVVYPWDADETSDDLCRIVPKIGARDKYFGASMMVQDNGGAGGTVVIMEFKNAAPDGYTLCQEAIDVPTLRPFVREISYTIDDFIPVAALSNESIIMIAGKDSGTTSVDDLLGMDSMTCSFSGNGDLMEPSQEQFFGMASVEATDISYDGSSPIIAVLLGGHIDVCTGHPDEAVQYVGSDDAVAIGIFNDERDPRESPRDIPTFKEMDHDATVSVWEFLVPPVGIPGDMVARATETLTTVTETDEYKELYNANQLLPLILTTEETVECINEEIVVNQELLVG